MPFINLPSVRGAGEPVSGSALGRILRRPWLIFSDSDDGHVKLKKPDDTLLDLEGGGGGETFNGGTITDPLVVDNSNAATQGLTVDAGGANGKVAKFRSDTGRVIASIGSLASTDSPLPVFDVSKSTVTVTVDPAIGGFFGVADPSGSTILDVEGSGSVSLEPPSGSTDNPFTIRTQDGTVALIMFAGGITSFRQMLRADAGLLINLNTAPADGDLSAGEVALWFDQTNGAAKLRMKGKSANGTVVTGNVALS